MVSAFEFPKIHSFPPLYTKQPNVTILQKQLDTWCDILLAYCQHYRITSLTLQGTILHSQLELNLDEIPPLFENPTINRLLSGLFREAVFKNLIQKLHRGEYMNSKRPEDGLLIYWRSLVEWSNLLYNYVERTGQLGQILTVYELTSLEDSGLDDDLRNIDYNLLVRILKGALIKQGKAQILMNEEGTEIGGVKIV